jgi:hypothetical protein
LLRKNNTFRLVIRRVKAVNNQASDDLVSPQSLGPGSAYRGGLMLGVAAGFWQG